MAVSKILSDNWKPFETVSGINVNSSALPNEWRAVAVKVAHATNRIQSYSFFITRRMVEDGTVFRTGNYHSSSDNGRACIKFTISSGNYYISTTDYEINGGSQGGNTRTQIDYY